MLVPQVFEDYETMSGQAAAWLIEHVRQQPDALLCLASGNTPARMYELVAEHYRANPHEADRLRVIKLDEWGGLPPNDPGTCEHHLRSVLIDPLGWSDRYVSFQSDPPDADAECQRISAWLADQGPIDLCILGLGVNGHVGFNEPAEKMQPRAHVADLSDTSLSHAMLNQTRGRPDYGLTLGMSDLFDARQILVLVSGAAKQEPLRRLLSGPISASFPASLLALRPRISLFCDAQAASTAEHFPQKPPSGLLNG